MHSYLPGFCPIKCPITFETKQLLPIFLHLIMFVCKFLFNRYSKHMLVVFIVANKELIDRICYEKKKNKINLLKLIMIADTVLF